MTGRWFGASLELHLFGLWVHLGTPDFTITNPRLRPSWRPRWEFVDYAGCHVESRYMLHVSWFFHLTLAWGSPITKEHDLEQGEGERDGVRVREEPGPGDPG